MSIQFIESCRLPTRWGEFQMHGFEDDANHKEHVALSMGDVSSAGAVLARVHSECLTGDGLFSLRCDCGPQLAFAMKAIGEALEMHGSNLSRDPMES